MQHGSYIIYPKLLGKGAFGTVYLGLHRDTGKLVAVKTETKANTNGKNAKVLRHEISILKILNLNSPLSAVVSWEDQETCYLVLPLRGPSLASLHELCNNKFSLQTCMMLGVSFIEAIEPVHLAGIVHRDIKPANLLMDYTFPHGKIHLVDFGLSKQYRDRNGKHLPYKTGLMRVGSLRYMSKYTHQGIEASCRDDLYSLIYVLIYLYVGDLPWKGVIKDLTLDQKHANVLSVKKSFTNRRLASKLNCKRCSGDPCTFMTEITKLLDYLDTLKFDDRPDYNRLKNYFQTIIGGHAVGGPALPLNPLAL